MASPGEHVNRRDRFDGITPRGEKGCVTSEGGGVAGDVDDVGRGEAEDGVDEGFFAAFARGIEDDEGLLAGEVVGL